MLKNIISMLSTTSLLLTCTMPMCHANQPLKSEAKSELKTVGEQTSKVSSCVLCNIVKNGTDITGRKPYVLYQNSGFIATVDLGSMIEGYVLITCKSHINSMGELTQEEFKDFDDIQSYVRENLKKIYNKDCICFEHGSGKHNQSEAASSVKHAHFHMVAIDRFTDELHEKILNDLEMFEIENECDLKNYVDKPYVYYVAGDGTKYVSTKSSVESQYMRKRLAEQFGKEWNWKTPETRKTFKENVLLTEQKWKEIVDKDVHNET